MFSGLRIREAEAARTMGKLVDVGGVEPPSFRHTPIASSMLFQGRIAAASTTGWIIVLPEHLTQAAMAMAGSALVVPNFARIASASATLIAISNSLPPVLPSLGMLAFDVFGR